MEQEIAKRKISRTVMVVNALCAGQFVFTFLYVNLFCKPVTQLHVALVGLSAIIGILLAGIFRRGYKDLRAYSNTKDVNREVNEIIKKVNQQD